MRFESFDLLEFSLSLRQWLGISLVFLADNYFSSCLSHQELALDNMNGYMTLSFELALNWIYSHNRYARNKSPFIYEYPPLHKPI